MARSITHALGKRALDGTWIREPMPLDARREAVEKIHGIVHVKLKDDLLKYADRKVVRQHRQRFKDLRAGKPVRFVVEREYVQSAQRSRHVVVELTPGVVAPVSAYHAKFLLSPEHGGMMVEECDAHGTPVIANPKDSYLEPVVLAAKPKPSTEQALFAVERQNLALKAEIERLKALAGEGVELDDLDDDELDDLTSP